jgi:hypothetical protein
MIEFLKEYLKSVKDIIPRYIYDLFAVTINSILIEDYFLSSIIILILIKIIIYNSDILYFFSRCILVILVLIILCLYIINIYYLIDKHKYKEDNFESITNDTPADFIFRKILGIKPVDNITMNNCLKIQLENRKYNINLLFSDINQSNKLNQKTVTSSSKNVSSNKLTKTLSENSLSSINTEKLQYDEIDDFYVVNN